MTEKSEEDPFDKLRKKCREDPYFEDYYYKEDVEEWIENIGKEALEKASLYDEVKKWTGTIEGLKKSYDMVMAQKRVEKALSHIDNFPKLRATTEFWSEFIQWLDNHRRILEGKGEEE